MLPYVIPVRDVDAKIGGNDFDRLRRWYRQGKLNRSAGIVRKRFPETLTPRRVAKLIRQGVLENARFAAAVLVRGVKNDQPLLVRWDASFPTLYRFASAGWFPLPSPTPPRTSPRFSSNIFRATPPASSAPNRCPPKPAAPSSPALARAISASR